MTATNDGDWTLEVIFQFETQEEAKAHMDALALIEPAALFAMHIHQEAE